MVGGGVEGEEGVGRSGGRGKEGRLWISDFSFLILYFSFRISDFGFQWISDFRF